MLDRASQRALVTGEWYIPGHKLMGFRMEHPASISELAVFGDSDDVEKAEVV